MTTRSADTPFGVTRAAADVAAERVCLKCRASFWSEGFGQRICSRCKGTMAWRSSVSEGSGQGRRRAGGRGA